MFIDSHCHLNFPELKSQITDIRAAMARARVTHAMVISTTLEEFPHVHEMATTYDNFWATVGVHPDNETLEDGVPVQEPTVEDLLSRAALPKVVGIGETGLDYYRLNGRSVADMEWQRMRFRVHIRAAQVCQKPLIIHTRNASDDTIAILQEMGDCGGVFHCFTETTEVARAALDLGFYISFSGIVTFKNAQSIRDAAAFVPLDRMLIETDSPYLAPAPYRGKTNTPAYVPYVAQTLAQLKAVSVEEIARITGDNYFKLFQGATR
ncbi:MAG: TatD family hydrolase [Cytophagales bacterium]|nr:TatD family hydrolase [Cytophagales bacterium]